MIAPSLIPLLIALGETFQPAPPATDAPKAPPAAFADATASPARRWYGWQLALSDVAFLTLGSLSRRGSGATVATAGLVLGAPLLHVANGDWQIGLGSAFVRVTLVAVVWSLGGTWAWRDSPPPCNGPREICDPTIDQVISDTGSGLAQAIGLLAVGGVLLLDDTVFSRTGGWSKPTTPPRARTMAPTLTPMTSGLAMGLVGTF